MKEGIMYEEVYTVKHNTGHEHSGENKNMKEGIIESTTNYEKPQNE